MASTAYIEEENQQCEAFLAVLAAAGWPGVIPPGQTAADAWVLLRPTLHALRVPRLSHRWLEEEVRDDPERYPWLLYVDAETQRRSLYVKLSPFLMRAGYRGRHPVCITYQVWHVGVTCALMRHGWYDPTTGHEPPAVLQVDALEIREHGRDVLNNLMPGMGDALSGHRPQTEEGRRNVGYLVTDEDGTQHMVRDCDLPDDDDEEDV